MRITNEENYIVFRPENQYDYFIIGQISNNLPHQLTTLDDTGNLLTEGGQPDFKIDSMRIPNDIFIKHLTYNYERK